MLASFPAVPDLSVTSPTGLEANSAVIRERGDIAAAAHRLFAIVSSLGAYRTFISHNIASRRPMVDAEGNVLAATVFGFEPSDDVWWRDPNLGITSPLAQACRIEGRPFWANAQGIHTITPNAYLASVSLRDFAQRSLVEAAIVVPVHLPFGQIGMAAYAPDGATDLSDVFAAHSDRLMLVTHEFVTSYVALGAASYPDLTHRRLTLREIECLRWAARGKTDHEISIIMDRAHSTVRFHLLNAASKLGTVSRVQSVYRATQLGYLSLER